MFTSKNVIIVVVYSYLLLKVIKPDDTQNKILLMSTLHYCLLDAAHQLV